jgi:hypothetical protein
MMKKILAVCCVLALSMALGASAAEPQPAKAAGAVPGSAAPATPPAAPAPAKPPAAGGTQASEPDRIEPTEKVRADSEISFPVDI